jgi:hypothetical protein
MPQSAYEYRLNELHRAAKLTPDEITAAKANLGGKTPSPKYMGNGVLCGACTEIYLTGTSLAKHECAP